MKKLLIFFLLFSSLVTHSQQENLFDTRWYATEMVVNGNVIPIPVLPANRPEGCFIGIEISSWGNDEADIDISLCWACNTYIHSIDSSSFVLQETVCLLCLDCGPCNPQGTSPLCTEGFLSEYESNQFAFYESIDVTFTYIITPLPDDHFALRIDKPNGDYIIYGTEETLSIPENEILSFSIVPNPTSGTFNLTGLKSDVESVVIYSVNGNKFPVVLDSNSYDASYLASGLYFISVTNVDGKKAVQKFIKK